ncbi:MAG: dehalogenase [Leptospiraceae bacterium]|nr:MAG: dehalogenase [Leptospiraceae bacterium]
MILIFDLMDTIIEDPFFSNFYNKLDEKQKKLWLAIKDHESYLLFEEGKILENEYFNRSYKKDPGKYQLPTTPKMKKIMFYKIEYLPGIKELFEKIQILKKDLNIYTILASNYSQWYHEVFNKKKELNEWFDYIFFSCEMGIRKPDHKFYQTIIESLPELFNKEELILFFDDKKENLEPLKDLGLNWEAIWINDKNKSSEIILTTIQKKCPQFWNAGK